jgi:hypothetical protein
MTVRLPALRMAVLYFPQTYFFCSWYSDFCLFVKMSLEWEVMIEHVRWTMHVRSFRSPTTSLKPKNAADTFFRSTLNALGIHQHACNVFWAAFCKRAHADIHVKKSRLVLLIAVSIASIITVFPLVQSISEVLEVSLFTEICELPSGLWNECLFDIWHKNGVYTSFSNRPWRPPGCVRCRRSHNV